MRLRKCRSGRAGLGAVALLVANSLVGCGTNVPRPSVPRVVSPTVGATVLPSSTPSPSSPTEFSLHRIDRTFPAVASLTSTGDRVYWASEGSIWRYTPGDPDAERLYENPDRGALVWEVIGSGTGFAFSEQLGKPDGAWRLMCVPGPGLAPVEVDRGVAERGRPPTLDLDDRRVAWAGFLGGLRRELRHAPQLPAVHRSGDTRGGDHGPRRRYR